MWCLPARKLEKRAGEKKHLILTSELLSLSVKLEEATAMETLCGYMNMLRDS